MNFYFKIYFIVTMLLTDIKTVKIISQLRKNSITNPIFVLHYRTTVYLLLTFCIIITSKQLFGEPIQCIYFNDKIVTALNAYCWMHGIFTLRGLHYDQTRYASPGVGPHEKNSEEYHHTYYQWIFIILLIEAIMFYLPYYLWKIWEGGRLNLLTKDLDSVIVKSENWTESRKREILEYLMDQKDHKTYAFRFAFCEILNFINVISQFLLLNYTLGGSFSNYGPAVASFLYNSNSQNNTNPMAWIFPKVTKCNFKYYGNSGSLQTLDAICILPLNVVNEKIFAFLWFWFLLLALFSAGAITYRIILLCSRKFRMYTLMCMIKKIPKSKLNSFLKKVDFDEWFILYQLGNSINSKVFKDLIMEMNEELDKKTILI